MEATLVKWMGIEDANTGGRNVNDNDIRTWRAKLRFAPTERFLTTHAKDVAEAATRAIGDTVKLNGKVKAWFERDAIERAAAARGRLAGRADPVAVGVLLASVLSTSIEDRARRGGTARCARGCGAAA